MARKVADSARGAAEKPTEPVQRLCNEIQLFDLCELERCGHKKGLFCTSPGLLSRFEAIAEKEERPAPGFISDEEDDGEERDDDGYDDDGYDDGYEEDPFFDEGREEDE